MHAAPRRGAASVKVAAVPAGPNSTKPFTEASNARTVILRPRIRAPNSPQRCTEAQMAPPTARRIKVVLCLSLAMVLERG